MNNSSMIMVKYRGPTNTRGSYMELQTWDLSHYNNKKICEANEFIESEEDNENMDN